MVLSAGTLVYRISDSDVLQVLIAHMGGPFWKNKDDHGWSIPKGEYEEGDDPRAVAAREFDEEMGSPLPEGELVELGTVKQPSGKKIIAFAVKSDRFDADNISSNLFEMEWPKGSGRIQSFPEVDRAAWVDCATARTKLVKGQVPFLDRLLEHLERSGVSVSERVEDNVLF